MTYFEVIIYLMKLHHRKHKLNSPVLYRATRGAEAQQYISQVAKPTKMSQPSSTAPVGAEITLIEPDDYHHHLRDGAPLRNVVQFAAASFSRILAMPNTKPPVRTLEDAENYRNQILDCLPADSSTRSQFQPLMSLYLTDHTTPDEIVRAKKSGIVYAAKLYPAGATTNSEFGLTDINKAGHIFKAMADCGMLLLVHGEVTDPTVDIFDRESIFINTILEPIIRSNPDLKVVMEHITTADAVEFVMNCGPNVAATITAHHLLYNRNDLFKGGICPHMYCLPILKRERHREALVTAATSGNPKFFLGTDSAPHSIGAKESACGCAGVFTGHAPLELYAEAFDKAGALDKLEAFAAIHGPNFYGIPINPNNRTVRLIKEEWIVPGSYAFGDTVVRPLRAGESITWKRQR